MLAGGRRVFLFHHYLVVLGFCPSRWFAHSRPAFARLALGGHLTRVIHEFYNRHLGVVALPAPKLDDACIAAVPVLISSAQLAEQPLNGFDPRRTFDGFL